MQFKLERLRYIEKRWPEMRGLPFAEMHCLLLFCTFKEHFQRGFRTPLNRRRSWHQHLGNRPDWMDMARHGWIVDGHGMDMEWTSAIVISKVRHALPSNMQQPSHVSVLSLVTFTRRYIRRPQIQRIQVNPAITSHRRTTPTDVLSGIYFFGEEC